MDSAEKRRYFRLELNQDAKCKLIESEGNRFRLLSTVDLNVELINLSPGGACIVCEGSISTCAIKRYSIIELVIKLTDGVLNLKGRVVWCEKTKKGIRAGVKFEDITDEKSLRIKEYLKNELRFYIKD